MYTHSEPMVGQRPRLDNPSAEEFQYYHATAVSFDNAAVRAWEFLRTNPLTGDHFRPVSHQMHPNAIGRIEGKELASIAAEIRELILRANETMQPYQRQREHDKNMNAIDRFYQFCKAHCETNEVAVKTYRTVVANAFGKLDRHVYCTPDAL